MKLKWGLIIRKDDIWVKVLAICKCRDDTLPTIARVKNGSRVWVSISKVWNKMIEGLEWSIGNGRNTSFWYDKWIPKVSKLCHHAIAPISRHLNDVRVVNMSLNYDTWDWNKIDYLLPNHIIGTSLIISSQIILFCVIAIIHPPLSTHELDNKW